MQRLSNFLIIGTLASVIFFATDLKVSANQLTFSVNPVLPKNQVDGKSGFFNIKLNAGQSQDLVLKYTNNTTKELTINSSISSAKTNVYGVVDYNSSNIKNDETLKYDISKLVKVPHSVTLGSGESKDVLVHVTMPADNFNGIIAGGLTFNDEREDKRNQVNKSEGLAISNIYSYQIALLMRQSTELTFSDEYIQSHGLKLNSVKAGQLNYRNVIDANLQNPLSVYINQMFINAEVSKSGSNRVLYSLSKGTMQMAPNTNFDFPIPIGEGVPMKQGTYSLKLTVYALQDNHGKFKKNLGNNKFQRFKYRWVFNKKFIIRANQAELYNSTDVTIKKINWMFYAILILIMTLLLLVIIFWIWILKHRQAERKVFIEEEVLDLDNQLIKVVRPVSMNTYMTMVKKGQKVKLVNDKL